MLEAAAGTRQVASNITEVAHDTGQASDLMHEVHSVTGTMTTQVGSLQNEIDRLMSTMRTHKVFDRRIHQRRPVSFQVSVSSGGANRNVQMINLSAGGAALVGFVEGTSGGRLDLNLPGLAGGLRGQILSADQSATHLKFERVLTPLRWPASCGRQDRPLPDGFPRHLPSACREGR